MIIGITGGKGGTGKSTIATAIAGYLAEKGDVLLIDADADCPNDHILLSLELAEFQKVEQRIPVWDDKLCTRCQRCTEVCRSNALLAIKGKVPAFFPNLCNGCGACHFVCSARAISWGYKQIGRIMTAQRDRLMFFGGELLPGEPSSEPIIRELNQIISDSLDRYEHIIVDTAAGTHCNVRIALEMCDHVLAVTEPTPLGRHDLGLILKLAQHLDKPAGVILNRYQGEQDEELVQLCKEHQCELVATVPYSKAIAEAYARGDLVRHDSIKDIIQRVRYI